jgi:hypothetical protein
LAEEDRMDVIGQNGNDGLHYDDPIVESVKEKMSARSKAGLMKYGQHLDRTDLSRTQWLIHAQEEAIDLANYIEVLIRLECKHD